MCRTRRAAAWILCFLKDDLSKSDCSARFRGYGISNLLTSGHRLLMTRRLGWGKEYACNGARLGNQRCECIRAIQVSPGLLRYTAFGPWGTWVLVCEITATKNRTDLEAAWKYSTIQCLQEMISAQTLESQKSEILMSESDSIEGAVQGFRKRLSTQILSNPEQGAPKYHAHHIATSEITMT